MLNLTPNEVVIFPMDGGDKLIIPPSGMIASATVEFDITFMEINGRPVQIRKPMFGPLIGMPPQDVPCIIPEILGRHPDNQRRKNIYAVDHSRQSAVYENAETGGMLIGVRRLISLAQIGGVL